jgi:hypothetical protein
MSRKLQGGSKPANCKPKRKGINNKENKRKEYIITLVLE